MAACLEELDERGVRLRGVLRGDEAASPRAVRGAVRELARRLRSEEPGLADALAETRLHRRVLDRGARAVRRDDPTFPAIDAARRRADAAKARLVAASVPLAVSVARKHRRVGVEEGDLVQEGTIGLMRAADKYDPRRGPFGAYARHWVRQQIRRALVEHARTIRVPLHVVEARARVERVRRAFERDHERAPTAAELLEATRVTPATLDAAQAMGPEPIPYHAPSPFAPDRTLLDQLTDGAPTADETLAKARFQQALRRSLDALPTRDGEILRLRFGLDGVELTLQEIGERYRVSRERIRRIEIRALAAMRASANREELAAYLAA